MSREVCGICWCPYDEDTGDCACPPPNVQKSTLREAAAAALEALEYHVEQTRPIHRTSEAITALKAALAEPEPPIGKASTDVGVPVYVVKKAEPVEPVEPVAWYHVPHSGNGISPMVSLSPQREPSMYAASVPLYLKDQL